MAALSAFDKWSAGLTPDLAGSVLVEAGRVLAGEIDDAGALGRSAAASVSQLRAVMAELRQKVATDDAEGDWSAPVLTAVRNTA